MRLLGSLAKIALAAILVVATAPPPAMLIRATQAGMQTLDQGEGGGNPFASALVELLGRGDVDSAGFADGLRSRTIALSAGFQTPDVPPELRSLPLALGRPALGERRIAMVLVMSDYAGGLASLPGAARDARRVGAALERAGFETRLVLDPMRGELFSFLDRFAAASAETDIALIYTTGHGIEVDGTGYLLDRDYPALLGLSAIPAHAVPLTRIGQALRARSANLLFYAGCRDNPFA